ncbi:hypothetical protein F2B00_09810 [Streptomyces parvus]|uniref:hypothetical protein n=1 Tax=Streptomyces parvus TaxID=66428 RepID=UPI00123A602D|nr:hypothetical protein [Streptomyces parvus]KAA6202476.1 hypothetical protein F2B00_09810 [Streptomyces parvus]
MTADVPSAVMISRHLFKKIQWNRNSPMIDAGTVMLRLSDRGLLPDDTVAVFWVGSVARGWANSTSDFNFYIISESAWSREGMAAKSAPLNPSVIPVHVLQVDGVCWKLKHWTTGQADQMLAKVGWEAFAAHRSGELPLVEIEELFVERLESGLPVSGAEWLARYRQLARESAFRAFITTRSLDAADRCAEDAAARLAAGDPHGAVLAARRAFGFTVDALLDSRGNHGIFTPKWRARRFGELRPDSLSFDAYWGIETMADLDQARPGDWVREVLAVCRRVAAEIGDVSAPAM